MLSIPLKDKRGHDKKVGVIPGIGKTAKKELEKNNITLAKQVLGHFLIHDKATFCDWLQKFDVNKGNQEECYEALKSFCDNHLW